MSQILQSAQLLRMVPRAPAMRFQRAIARPRTRGLRIQPTRPVRAMPKEEHSAHTISQRLRTLKKIPPELVPLGVVISFAIFAAVFAMGKKLATDKTLRLWKNPKKSEH